MTQENLRRGIVAQHLNSKDPMNILIPVLNKVLQNRFNFPFHCEIRDRNFQ